ncbi:MAG: peptidoglycan-binding protein [Pseudomonadota bacterium]
MLAIDSDLLREIAPRFSGAKAARQSAILASIDGELRGTLAEYDINTPLRIAHFIAQIAHESAGFRTTEEFASGAAYEGRTDLGNTERGDGRRFKGRGLLQLTGRANYKTYGDALGVDLIADPEAAADPPLSLRIACEYWKRRRINPPSDRDDLIRVTRLVNGGLNGLDDRRRYLGLAKTALARLAANAVARASDPAGRPVLRRGQQNPVVAELQEALAGQGLDLAVDGDFGPATELAVKVWQRRQGLAVDGIVGPATWGTLLA